MYSQCVFLWIRENGYIRRVLLLIVWISLKNMRVALRQAVNFCNKLVEPFLLVVREEQCDMG